MPTYEFRCPEGHEFEKFYRTISGAEAQAACPTCGQISERMMSATGFAFKGSGFYLTDYGKNAHREKGTPTPASPAAGEGGKSEAPRSDGAKSESSSSGSSTTASEASKPAAAAESKPAPAPAKKSTGE
jgi:putative FmdB family regulatory protein